LKVLGSNSPASADPAGTPLSVGGQFLPLLRGCRLGFQFPVKGCGESQRDNGFEEATDVPLVAPGRVELPTFGLGNRCSIHLSYGAGAKSFHYLTLALTDEDRPA
jgi:hypothetical protein